MKTLQNLAAPSSIILNKQEMCFPRVGTSKSSNIGSTGNKPNLAINTSRSLKFNKLINASMPLINDKETDEKLQYFNAKSNADNFNGRLLQNGHSFQQNFLIRSCELGPDCKMSIGALINLLQESSLNHVKIAGLVTESNGSTPEMIKKDLVWVVYKMKIVGDSYPSWGDVLQVDTWACEWRRKGVRRDWLVHDFNTRKILFRATSVYVMMNKKTRKLSKYLDETREETKAIFMECDPIIDEDSTKLRELDFESADYVRTGLSPQWTDIDVNQHVNHAKYIDWVIEGVPDSVVENHKLCGMSLEFRKECGKNNSLLSLSAFATKISQESLLLELDHTIRLQNGSEILRGRTIWTPRK